MRLIVQRTDCAKVSVNNNEKGIISQGLFVLVGVKKGDTLKDAENLAGKLSKLRVMADENGKMNLSVQDVKKKILAVSQFTLYADTAGGNRPSFIQAAEPDQAERVYDHFVDELKKLGLEVATGEFGAYMKIETTLDGPVTIILDS